MHSSHYINSANSKMLIYNTIVITLMIFCKYEKNVLVALQPARLVLVVKNCVEWGHKVTLTVPEAPPPELDLGAELGIPFNILQCSTPRQGMLDYAVHSEAVVITRDDFSDLQGMKPEWDKVIRNSLLAPLFANDGVDEFIQWPNNPLGPWGPTLDTT